MYWGDAKYNRIEAANLDGTGRTILRTASTDHYFAFAFHAGSIYFTDWRYAYGCLFSSTANSSKIVYGRMGQ